MTWRDHLATVLAGIALGAWALWLMLVWGVL